MKHVFIKATDYYLPKTKLTNHQLATEFPDWSVEKIEKKTGINERHISGDNEYVSDMAVAAAEKIFEKNICKRQNIDFLLLCTQSPDYLLPTTACIVQDKLGLSKTVGALDINLGCSGFLYGLSLAKGLIQSNQVKNVLLVTADTYTKFINQKDKSVRTLFGDASAATLISKCKKEGIEDFIFGTDGRGAENLIVSGSGMKGLSPQKKYYGKNESLNSLEKSNNLYMNGPEIFNFTLNTIPQAFQDILNKTKHSIEDIDHFIFHQANEYMLIHLRDKLNIPKDKFFISMKNHGNTVSSSIPIVLNHALTQKKINRGDRIMLLGFGVGYSWAGTVIRWL
jgi:3-oxoacyl-[acyl-carrier-protein] synthase-3